MDIVRSTDEVGVESLSLRNTGTDVGNAVVADIGGADLDDVLSGGLSEGNLTKVVLPQPYGFARAGAAVFQVFEQGSSKSGTWKKRAVVHAGIAAAIISDESKGGSSDVSGREGADCMVFGFEDGGCNVDSGALWTSCVVLDLGVQADVFEEALFEHHSKWSAAEYSEDHGRQGVNCFDYVITFMNMVAVGGRVTWNKLDLSSLCLTRAFADAESYAALHSMLEREPSRTLRHEPALFQCTLVSVGDSSVEVHAETSECAVCRDYNQWRSKWDAAIGGGSGSGGGGGGGGGSESAGSGSGNSSISEAHVSGGWGAGSGWREDAPGAWE